MKNLKVGMCCVVFILAAVFSCVSAEDIRYGYCENALNIREAPWIDSKKVGEFPANSKILILKTINGWYQVEGGYVKKEYVKDFLDFHSEGTIIQDTVIVQNEPNRKGEVIGYYKKGDKVTVEKKINGYLVLSKCGYILEEMVDFTFSNQSVLTLEDMTRDKMINTRIHYIATLSERTLGKGVTTNKSLYFVGRIPIYDIIEGEAYFPSGRQIYKIKIEKFQEIHSVGEEHAILSAYRTVYHSSTSGRKKNIELVATYLTKTIAPNEIFSFNESTGRRSANKGYELAPVQANGQIEEDYGGGVCQVSSTIYATVMQTEKILIENRKRHGQEVLYLPYGMDATVNYGSIDFKFKNGYDYAVCLEVEAKDGAVLVLLKKCE